MYIYDDIKQDTYISFNIPETLKIFSEAKNNALKALENSDGLIIPGNVNMVDARLFGEAISPHDMQSHNLERNIAEMALIHVATQRGIPILGICGGHQILNTYFGGKIGHKSDDHNSYVNIIPDSELSQIIFGKPSMSIGKEKFWEAHQQVVKEIGGTNHINGKHDLFKAVAYTNDDIEAIESQFGASIMGIQFHPEMSTYSNAFTCSEKARDKKIYLAFQQSVRSFHNKQVLLTEFKNSKHYSKTQHPTEDIAEKPINYESNIYNNNIIDMFNATSSDNNNSVEIIGYTNVEILD
ncbi:gamma-glutamyl-gamma-aminobutyrate hydrolase family protein [Rickettsia sp. TH2014]|uniref:gamma-glutamyl-gamma-aminobutyrate hydrolase family protein n=1 Tax=Rickettsia sp. TH2014 TaxID=1967503 RepID=UPI001C45FBD7|nr:gamma-glutamyl-gamma-aminobutyrate hydrolase family protein [Rickettsia sp. TH2014]